jgi:dihydrodipicolinate synthase/N-acetylneuraminate lyase
MHVSGTGVPLATPFDEDGALRRDALRSLVTDLDDRGVDFFVPCGSNSEAAKMGADTRRAVVETVAAATDVPVVAGTGHPGLRETLRETERAADAGADAALVVTPFYHRHDDATLRRYYRAVADESPVPVYLYSVPKYTDVALDPRTVEALATHPNVAGIKDSSGDLGAFQRIVDYTADADFAALVGSGSVYAAGLDAGADGGVLALANVAPGAASDVYRRHRDGDDEGARALNRRLVDLNHAVTAEYGIPGLKAAMRERGLSAGHPREPYDRVDESDRAQLRSLVEPLSD